MSFLLKQAEIKITFKQTRQHKQKVQAKKKIHTTQLISETGLLADGLWSKDLLNKSIRAQKIRTCLTLINVA